MTSKILMNVDAPPPLRQEPERAGLISEATQLAPRVSRTTTQMRGATSSATSARVLATCVAPGEGEAIGMASSEV